MGFDDANSVLRGPRDPAISFKNIGDSITGVLVDADVAPVTDPKGEVQVDKNGNVKKQVIYTLQTDLRDPEIEDDNGKRRLFAKWAIQKAISEFLAENGLAQTGLQEGGTLTVTFVKTEPAKTRGYNDTKLYEASYVPPGPKQLPTGTSEKNPWTKDELVDDEPKFTQAQQDTAWAIYNADPNTPLSVISAASKIPEADLKQMFAI